MKKIILTLFLLSFIVITCYSQNSHASKYISISFIKSKTPDYIEFEKEFWKPIHQQLINEGKKDGWYLYKLRYPNGTQLDYDFIILNVYSQWELLENPYENIREMLKKSNPDLDVNEFMMRTETSGDISWGQLYQLIDQATEKVEKPSQYVILNQMKVVDGSESEYVNLETSYFKSFHAARIDLGILHYWGLYKTALPYGSKYEYDYMTLNGFDSWEDITGSNPKDLWEKVHGETNESEIHDKILSKRATVNNELWELIDYADKAE